MAATAHGAIAVGSLVQLCRRSRTALHHTLRPIAKRTAVIPVVHPDGQAVTVGAVRRAGEEVPATISQRSATHPGCSSKVSPGPDWHPGEPWVRVSRDVGHGSGICFGPFRVLALVARSGPPPVHLRCGPFRLVVRDAVNHRPSRHGRDFAARGTGTGGALEKVQAPAEASNINHRRYLLRISPAPLVRGRGIRTTTEYGAGPGGPDSDSGRTASVNRPRRETSDVLVAHLKGDMYVGVYPLLDGDRCWWLAADFDGMTL